MSVRLPNGSQFAIGSTFAASKAMSAISNAAEAVATLEASHGIVENDIMIMTSGWGRLNNRVVRADSVATNDVTLEDIDTSSTVYFPAGSGTGSIIEVTAWTAITQILNFGQTGGDLKQTPYQFVEEYDEYSLPAGVSAKTIEFTLGDDQSMPWFSVLRAASAAKTVYPLRITLTNGNVIYHSGIVHFDEQPSMDRDQVMGLKLTFSLQARSTRYSA